MARSLYVYLVEDHEKNVIRSCTVKHELFSWLNMEFGSDKEAKLRVYRMPDNRDGPKTEIPDTEWRYAHNQ